MTSQDRRPPLTDRSYWEELWQAADNAKLFDPADRSIRNRGNVAMHDFFSEILRAADPPAQSLVEIGCAQSKWLPYFAKVHNLSVAGLDYSNGKRLVLTLYRGVPG